jgi:uncharacterized membrane protein
MKVQMVARESILVLGLLALVLILILIPTGFERKIYSNAVGTKARVIAVDNTTLLNKGVVRMGEQVVTVRLLGSPFKGMETKAVNLLGGKLEFDTVYQEGDLAWVLLEQSEDGQIIFANMVSLYRFPKELQLLLLFATLLLLVSGRKGLRTLLSFTLAFLLIWKVLIPLCLKGYEPILIALLVGAALTVSCLLLVAGLTRKAYCAIASSLLCSLVTCLLATVGTSYFSIHGAVMSWSESLLFAGFEQVNLTKLLQAAIYLSCSGAILDLAVDISAALDEVHLHNRGVTRKELFASGMHIGQSVVGSQTTTLLLAYIGSYLTIMMVYMAQGTPLMSILNSQSVAAEILHTLIGCIGLVLVAPLTSLVCASVYSKQTTPLAPSLSAAQEPSCGVGPDR